jgi:hypothetical protein
VRQVLEQEVDLRARGTQFIHKNDEGMDSPSALYRARLNSKGSPSQTVASGYRWSPGTELREKALVLNPT